MALNGTIQDRMNRARQELVLKKQLEIPVKQNIVDLLEDINSEALKNYANTGTVLQVQSYKPEFVEILMAAYMSSYELFAVGITNHVLENREKISELLVRAFSLIAATSGNTLEEALDEFQKTVLERFTLGAENQANESADLIINTTQEDLERSTANAVEAIQESQKQLFKKTLFDDIASMAASFFKVSFTPRATLIAVTEVQFGSEFSKYTENQTFQDVIDEFEITGQAQVTAEKQWFSVGDDRVREAHMEADSQRVKNDEAFEVGGELMLFPRDTSLGASAWNICNCRCAAIYYHEGNIDSVLGV